MDLLLDLLKSRPILLLFTLQGEQHFRPFPALIYWGRRFFIYFKNSIFIEPDSGIKLLLLYLLSVFNFFSRSCDVPFSAR